MKRLVLVLFVLFITVFQLTAQSRGGDLEKVEAQEVAVYPQLGHSKGIYSVAFSSDGKQVLSGSNDQTIRLWDAASGRVIKTFFGHTDTVLSVALSPDNTKALSGSNSMDNSVKLWDVASGRVIRTYDNDYRFCNGVWAVAFSPDGTKIVFASGTNDYTIRMCDVATGNEIKKFSGHTDDVNSVAFSPDGKQLLTGSHDYTIKLWDVASGNEIKTFKGHSYDVNSVAFSPDGKQIISGSDDKTIKLWDVASGKEIRTFTGHAYEVKSVAFSSNGKQVFSGSTDKTAKLWDIASGKVIRTFSGHTEYIMSVALSPDGKQAVSGSYDDTVKLWDVASGREIRTLTGHTAGFYSVAFSKDGKQALTYSGDNTFKLWDMATGRESRSFKGHTSKVNTFAFSPDGKFVISGSEDKTVKLWDITNGKVIKTFSGHTSAINSVAFSPDGKQILSGSSKEVKLWDITSGSEIKTISGGVHSVLFSPDGKQILLGSDKTINLRDISSDQDIKIFKFNSSIHTIAFSPNGKQILVDYGYRVYLLDVESGNVIKSFEGHSGWNRYSNDGVRSVAFSPDGRQALSGSSDTTVKLWDVASGKEIKTFSGHSNNVIFVAFSPDGKKCFSGSYDGTLRIWDINTGKETAQFVSFDDGEWIAVTSDGYYNCSPNGDKYLNVRVGNSVYGIDQYRQTFYKPQIVEARLQGKPDPVRVTAKIQDAASFTAPVVTISNPTNGASVSSNRVELTVTVVDQKQPIKTIQVLVNGRLVGGETMRGGITVSRGGEIELDPAQLRLKGNENRVEFKLPVTLDSGDNLIEVLAKNPYSQGRAVVEVRSTAKNELPSLWILSVGVNRYDDNKRLPNLSYAVNDASEIISVFKTQEGRLYRKVNSLLITDNAQVKPTRGNILKYFAEYYKQADERDVKILFIAGHGINDDNGDYYFMPSDAIFNADGSINPTTAISYKNIQSVLETPGQKLIFIDSCHSEGVSGKTRKVDNNRLIGSLLNNSTVIFTACRGSESSLESSEYKHGIFTYAIIQGMKGGADFFKNGKIKMKALDAYVSETVEQLTNRSQQPTTNTPDGYVNFIVAEIK